VEQARKAVANTPLEGYDGEWNEGMFDAGDVFGELTEEQSRKLVCGRNSAVECQLPKLDVAGSNPVARSPLRQ
jgi:hypothetical protein